MNREWAAGVLWATALPSSPFAPRKDVFRGAKGDCMTCKKVTYWGKVQGVGFRYTASGLAQKYPVMGYVKNLLDGQVELVAEGEVADVDRFLESIASRLAGFIKGQKIQDEMSQGFIGFTIRESGLFVGGDGS